MAEARHKSSSPQYLRQLTLAAVLALCSISGGCAQWEIDRASKLTGEFEAARTRLYGAENEIRKLGHEAALMDAALASAREKAVGIRQDLEHAQSVLMKRRLELGQLRRTIRSLCEQPVNDGRYRNTKNLFYHALDLRDKKSFEAAGTAFYEYYCQERMSEDGLLGLAFAGECFAFTGKTTCLAWVVRVLSENNSSMNAKTQQFAAQLERRLPQGYMGRLDELYRKLSPAEEAEATAEQEVRIAEGRDRSVQQEIRDLVDQKNRNEDQVVRARMDKRQAIARIESFISGASRQMERLEKYAKKDYDAGAARDGLYENIERARELLERSD